MKIAALSLLVLAAACRSPQASDWKSPIVRWGSLSEVLREGRSESRGTLGEVGSREMIGLGIGPGLMEELVLVDGEAWVGRSTGERTWSVRHGAPKDAQATFLVATSVRKWREVVLDHDVDASAFESWLANVGSRYELGATWPFVISGRLEELEAHILRGACPLADPKAPDPVEPPWTSGDGRLVGFFAIGSEGVITHHGQRTHVHAIVDKPDEFVGHVDAVSLRAGAVLRIPAR